MAALNDEYDVNADPSGVMEEHQCVVQIVNSDYKSNSAGTGKLIALEWAIVDGKYNGRKLFSNLNIKHPNEQAQQIGNAEFAAIRKALFGTKDRVVKDTVELHGIPCRATVKCEKRKDNGEMQNVLRNFKSLSEVAESGTTKTETSGAGRPF